MATGRRAQQLAVDFIEATRRIKESLPYARISGGVSNVSFSFRGNEPVRRAIHSVFLYHAIAAGMDMGIVNAGDLPVYDTLDPELREAVEDVILNRKARRRLSPTSWRPGPKYKAEGRGAVVEQKWREARLRVSPTPWCAASPSSIEADTEEARRSRSAAARHRGPLMDSMNVVGDCSRGQDVPAPGGQVRGMQVWPI